MIRLMIYNWQQPDWPHFHYDLTHLGELLCAFSEKTGRVSGLLSGLPEPIQTDTLMAFMVAEAVHTSAIEGEYVSRQDVMSSIRRHLKLEPMRAAPIQDKKAQGIASILWDVRKTFSQPLTNRTLWDWHRKLLPQSSSFRPIAVGQWRTHEEPMQVISGPSHKPKIHFEAPPSQQIPKEMKLFLKWFNDSAPHQKNAIKIPLVRSAIVHLYFETIHPFEDGNGRIGRALAEKALAQSLNRPILLSLSESIESNKKSYYQALKTAQRSNEITAWLHYFIKLAIQAQNAAEDQIQFILKKSTFLDYFKPRLNARQLKTLLRMLEEGPHGFSGGISAKKYSAITGASKATATRDLTQLFDWGVLKQIGSGRSTHYEIRLEQTDPKQKSQLGRPIIKSNLS